ncbi:hypothetical protein LTR70_009278 [Exophiala xenobiotica]|uniref:JmjC domain-containing protein n=1 Tax=Lithohypha guttulata TaxID=1690604 RepID=A0ABR0JXX6_9EURO|nr:hypothetical protein LTR24_009130 [Lithohypha guttulata]KAK5310711.1 hypothetical protein LTR70_009278 [Exophiala xenobiotica]
MPTGTVHAVFTSSDSLCVGKHFYTAGTMGASLDVVRFLESHADLTNEDPPDYLYSLLNHVSVSAEAVMNPRQLQSFSLALKDFGTLRLSDSQRKRRPRLLEFVNLAKKLGSKMYHEATNRMNEC